MFSRKSQAGVGFSERRDTAQACEEALDAALEPLGEQAPRLVLVSGTAQHDLSALHHAVRERIGEGALVVGSSAAGVLTNTALGYSGAQVGVAAIASDVLQPRVHYETGLAGKEKTIGASLGRKVAEAPAAGGALLMYDSVRATASEGGPRLNLATPLVEGFMEEAPHELSVAGVGVLADPTFACPAQLSVDGSCARQSALALAFGEGVQMETLVLHGYRPASPYYTLTRVDGNVVYEIEGRPALEVIGEMLGASSTLTYEDYPFLITLGLNRADPFGPFREEDYANRLCFGVEPEQGALVMFEPDLQTGDRVQLMRRSITMDYIGREIDRLRKRLAGRPFFAYYIDCAGRTSVYSGTESEEAAVVQEHLRDIPLFGVFSGVEIARVGGEVRPLDLTGVLCVFTEEV